LKKEVNINIFKFKKIAGAGNWAEIFRFRHKNATPLTSRLSGFHFIWGSNTTYKPTGVYWRPVIVNHFLKRNKNSKYCFKSHFWNVSLSNNISFIKVQMVALYKTLKNRLYCRLSNVSHLPCVSNPGENLDFIHMRFTPSFPDVISEITWRSSIICSSRENII